MRYILLIYDDEAREQEIQEKEFPEWSQYTKMLQDAGALLGGEPLEPTSTSTTVRGKKGGSYDIADGPYVETKEALGGYYMIEAADLDKATELAAKMPHVKRGGIVEIRPIMELNM